MKHEIYKIFICLSGYNYLQHVGCSPIHSGTCTGTSPYAHHDYICLVEGSMQLCFGEVLPETPQRVHYNTCSGWALQLPTTQWAYKSGIFIGYNWVWGSQITGCNCKHWKRQSGKEGRLWGSSSLLATYLSHCQETNKGCKKRNIRNITCVRSRQFVWRKVRN